MATKRPRLQAQSLVLNSQCISHMKEGAILSIAASVLSPLHMAFPSFSTPIIAPRSFSHVRPYSTISENLLINWSGLDGMLDNDEKYFKEHGEPLFSSHMIDLSEEAVDYNIETTAKYLKRAAPMKQWLEMVRIQAQSLTFNAHRPLGNWHYRRRGGWCE